MNPFSLVAMAVAAALLVYFWFRKASMVQALAIANLAVFVVMLVTGDKVSIRGSPLLADLAFRPSYLVELDAGRLYTAVTAQFLHADLFHILGNLLVLLLAGMPLEERLGRARFLAVYFGSGIVAVLLHVLWVEYATGAPLSVPVVGASGCVFGILGALAAAYPRAEIPMFLIILIPRVPAFIVAIVYAMIEGVALLGGIETGVANAAHIGGALGGAILAPLLKPPPITSAAGPRRLDYEALERLAPDERGRQLVARVRENGDQPELQRAWLDRLLVSLRCPQCGTGFAEAGRGMLECDQGHRERYAV